MKRERSCHILAVEPEFSPETGWLSDLHHPIACPDTRSAQGLFDTFLIMMYLMSEARGEHAYRVMTWWTCADTGLAKSDSAPNAIHFTTPVEPAGAEGRWTPEELLLASIAGCFTTTFWSIAQSAQFIFTDLIVKASGTVLITEYGYTLNEIVIRPVLTVASSKEANRARGLLNRAENLCLVSRAIHARLSFQPQVQIAEVSTLV